MEDRIDTLMYVESPHGANVVRKSYLFHNSLQTRPSSLPYSCSSTLLGELGDTGQVLSLEELQAVVKNVYQSVRKLVDSARSIPTHLAPPPVET